MPSPVSASADIENGAVVPSALAFNKIDQMIDQLAAAGALDEGNKRALDGLIASWQAQHREALTAFHLDVAGDREQRIKALRLRIEFGRERLASAKQHLATLDAPEPLPAPDDHGPQTTEVAP